MNTVYDFDKGTLKRIMSEFENRIGTVSWRRMSAPEYCAVEVLLSSKPCQKTLRSDNPGRTV